MSSSSTQAATGTPALRCPDCGAPTEQHGYNCGVADAIETEAAVERDLYEVPGDEYLVQRRALGRAMSHIDLTVSRLDPRWAGAGPRLNVDAPRSPDPTPDSGFTSYNTEADLARTIRKENRR